MSQPPSGSRHPGAGSQEIQPQAPASRLPTRGHCPGSLRNGRPGLRCSRGHQAAQARLPLPVWRQQSTSWGNALRSASPSSRTDGLGITWHRETLQPLKALPGQRLAPASLLFPSRSHGVSGVCMCVFRSTSTQASFEGFCGDAGKEKSGGGDPCDHHHPLPVSVP